MQMDLLSIEDIQARYDDHPSRITVYKYLKEEELRPYIVIDGSKKLKAEGLEILDKIRERKEKFRPKPPANNEKASKNGTTGSDIYYTDLIDTLSAELDLLHDQLKIKDKQIETLTGLLDQQIKTIAFQSGALKLTNGKDNGNPIIDINGSQETQRDAPIIKKKKRFGWFSHN